MCERYETRQVRAVPCVVIGDRVLQTLRNKLMCVEFFREKVTLRRSSQNGGKVFSKTILDEANSYGD